MKTKARQAVELAHAVVIQTALVGIIGISAGLMAMAHGNGDRKTVACALGVASVAAGAAAFNAMTLLKDAKRD